MKNTMTEVKELLEMVKGIPAPENVKSLLADLEQFIQAQEAVDNGSNGEEAFEKWHSMRDKLQRSFENLGESLGYTPEMIQTELQNSPELESFIKHRKEA